MTDFRSQYRLRRLRFLERHVDLGSCRGLEIGAFDYPTVSPEQGSCEYADFRTREQLAAQFEIPAEKIVPTHFLITRDQPISEQIEKRFDYIILCHVLEHVPDVVGYLADLGQLLNPEGVVVLAIPDQRRTLDLARPATTIDDILERHRNGAKKPGYRDVASFAREWLPELREQEETNPRAFHDWVATQIKTDSADVHINVWKDREFFSQVEYLERAGFLDDLSVRGFEGNAPPFNEFYLALQRTENGQQARLPIESPVEGIFYRSCNGCGSDSFREFKSLSVSFPKKIYGDTELTYPKIGKHLGLLYLECVQCGLIGINPLTCFSDIDKGSFDGERNIVAWSEGDYGVYESDKFAMTQIIYEQYELERFRKLNTVLDVGCGPGVSLSWYRDQQSWAVFGTDPDLYSQRQARERYDLSIDNGLIYDSPLAEESLDLISMDNSLEHTFSPVAALLRAYRLLRPGGALFIFVPNSEGLSTTHLDANAYWGHWFFYSPKALVRILREIGFEVPRLIAIQNPVNPALAPAGVDVTGRRDELVVRMETDPVVVEGVETKPIRADFFNLLATKPEAAPRASPREDELLRISEDSRIERTRIYLERPAHRA